MQIPGGWLATRFGGKYVFGVSIGIPAVLTLLTPLAAQVSVWAMVALRVIEGLFEVCVATTNNLMYPFLWSNLYHAIFNVHTIIISSLLHFYLLIKVRVWTQRMHSLIPRYSTMANTSVNPGYITNLKEGKCIFWIKQGLYCVVHKKPGCSIRKVMFRLISVSKRYFKQHLLVYLFCLILSIVIVHFFIIIGCSFSSSTCSLGKMGTKQREKSTYYIFIFRYLTFNSKQINTVSIFCSISLQGYALVQ